MHQCFVKMFQYSKILITTLVSGKKEKKAAEVFDALAAETEETGTCQLHHWSGKWEAAVERFIIAQNDFSQERWQHHIVSVALIWRGGRLSIQAGKRRVRRLAASVVIVGERLHTMPPVSSVDQIEPVSEAGHWDAVQLLSVRRRAGRYSLQIG